MSRAFRHAQSESFAGHHDAAAKLFAQARRDAPTLPHLALQEALAEARAGRPDTALRILRRADCAQPPYRLFEGWLQARCGQVEQGLSTLAALVAEQPGNRVAATALAYCQLRAGQVEPALTLLADHGDNLELLSWAWAELERQAPSSTAGDLPPLPAGSNSRRAARRWFAAGQAALFGHVQSAWRHALLASRWAAPLHPLLRALEGPWPTDALVAFRRADATGHALPLLSFHLGAALYDAGHWATALAMLERAGNELEAELARRLDRAKPEQRDAERALFEAGEEACTVRLYRAAALTELGRWDEAETALDELAALSDDEEPGESGRVHEFAVPEWFVCRGRCRLARGRFDAGRADLERALVADPAVFAARLARLRAAGAQNP
ncbi:MAG: hypothetical protein HZB16_01000 [Armatimonadetes bacterium]|nr:hypothetical protein [Armatimonadota bacterium]